MRFCPNCGARSSGGVPTGDDRDRHVCPACGTVHYQNPKVVVGSVCTLGDRLLLCRRAIPPRRGFWTIPAGYLELGETAEEGAVREAWEEARARIELEGLLAVYSVRRIDQVQLLYRARLLDAAVEAGPESLEVRLRRLGRDPMGRPGLPDRALDPAARRSPCAAGPALCVTVGNPGPAPAGAVPGRGLHRRRIDRPPPV